MANQEIAQLEVLLEAGQSRAEFSLGHRKLSYVHGCFLGSQTLTDNAFCGGENLLRDDIEPHIALQLLLGTRAQKRTVLLGKTAHDWQMVEDVQTIVGEAGETLG